MNKIEVLIKSRIHTIQGLQVMLDCDLAQLYGVSTKRLNEQVKRNSQRFPEGFMFQLTKEEKTEVVAKCDHLRNLKYSYVLPFVFTEQGVSRLSAVLNSKKAVEISIMIINAFVEMRRFLVSNATVFEKFHRIDQKLLEHDENFNKLFDAMEQKQLTPRQGIFFNGQVFVSIRSATP